MQKIIQFVSGKSGQVVNSMTISCNCDEKVMPDKVKQSIIEALTGGKQFATAENDIANINDWSIFGNNGDKIIVEDE